MDTVKALKTFSVKDRGSVKKGTTLYVSSSEELEVLVLDPKHLENLINEGALKIIKSKENKDGDDIV